MSEHILAAVKPNSLKCFSTLDPLMTTSTNLVDEEPSRFPILHRVARLLQGDAAPPCPPEDATQVMSPSRSDNHSSSSTVYNVNTNTAATTLEEGAVPVRELPQNLVSEPASLVASATNSSEDLTKLDDTSKHELKRFSSQVSLAEDSTGVHKEELRCVIAVIRHGDRTPKQKLKVTMTEPLILEYFMTHTKHPEKDLKVKDKAPLTEFLVMVKTILAEKDQAKLEAEQAGVQIKQNTKVINQLKHMRDILERWKITGLNRKLQIKPREWEENQDSSVKKKCTEVQLILKWGGNLTKLGENQAIRLGEKLRHGLYPDAPGGGILRLHSTFRHDLKIKTSDEGRVMKTAAAFAKGLLELEGEIPPILVSLVHKEKGSMHMLDPSGDKEVKLELDECKERITANLQRDVDWRATTEEERERMVGPAILHSMRDALAELGNPRTALMDIYKTMGNLIEQLEEMLGLIGSNDEERIEGGEGLKGDDEDDVALSGVKLYKGETLLELTERWKFIYKRFYDPDEDVFDLSRIPDVHDNVRFDVLHNPHLGLSSTLEKLYELAKSMADCVVPQEYGTTIAEKRSVGVKICGPLLEKIRYDLNIARTDNKTDMRYMINMEYSADLPINTMGRRIRTRLYFTSESHLHTLCNCMRFAGGEGGNPILSDHGIEIINNTRELCYLTQVIIRLFEDPSRRMDDPRRFRVEILFSAGATATPLHIHEANRYADLSRLDTNPLEPIGRDGLTCKDVEDFFNSAIIEGGHGSGDTMSVGTDDGRSKQFPTLSDGTPISPDAGGKRVARTLKQHTSIHLDDLNERLLDALGPHTFSSEATQGDLPESGTMTPASTSNDGPKESLNNIQEEEEIEGEEEEGQEKGDLLLLPNRRKEEGQPQKPEEEQPDHPTSLESKYFWSAVAAGTFLLGAACVVLALSLGEDRRGYRRRTSIIRT